MQIAGRNSNVCTATITGFIIKGERRLPVSLYGLENQREPETHTVRVTGEPVKQLPFAPWFAFQSAEISEVSIARSHCGSMLRLKQNTIDHS